MAHPSTRRRPAAPRDRRPAIEPGLETSPPPAVAEPREEARTDAVLNVIAGIWLIVAPFVLGYGDGDPYWNDIVFGALIALVGVARVLSGTRYAWLSGLNMLFGAWVFAAAFWLDATARASWNDAIVGAIVFLLGAVAASGAPGRPPPPARGAPPRRG